MMGEESRSFTVVSSSFGHKGGRYVSAQPMDAGRKAGRILFEKADKKSKASKENSVVYIEMKETTRSKKVTHSKERYFYSVTRVKIPLADRIERKFKKPDGTLSTFTPKYNYEVAMADKDAFPADHVKGGSSSFW
jgi:hypothetical protein